ncbi:YHS domain-containing (seleno)protein [Photobacterium alginatilyticum]|uniref:YHS domain-containing protein n=2 Tax=Photobacterium alginatilyticum TaxID=1775171 RepID=A0ABW9YE82_9GAMM|nr:YHS domain-containing protein [Photobacterium alginatilyticum]
MNMFIKFLRLFAVTAVMSISTAAFSADIDVSADNNDIAIKGYDPVAYFTESKALKGNKAFTATYKNAIYQFSSADNRDAFKAEPDKYAPQYGGYCAFGVAMGKKFETDPNAWKVVDNKLYLNLDKSVQKRWLEDVPGYINTANTNWSTIKTVEADKL